MNDNPILLKDTLLSSRGLFLPLLISITNLVLLILLIGNLYYISLKSLPLSYPHKERYSVSVHRMCSGICF